MSVKIKIILGLGVITLIGLGFFVKPKLIKEEAKNLGATILFPSGGGTGLGSATTSDIGKAIIVSSSNPLIYKFGTVSGGSSSSVGTSAENYFTYYNGTNSVTGTPLVQLLEAGMVVTTNSYFNYVSSTNLNFASATGAGLVLEAGDLGYSLKINSGYFDIGNTEMHYAGGLYVSEAAAGQFSFSSDSGLTFARLNASNLTSERQYDFQDDDGTIPLLEISQSWGGTQTFSILNFTSASGASITSTNAYFNYVSSTVLDSVTGTFHVLKSDGSDGLLLEANNGTDIGVFGAGNSSNSLFYGGATINGLFTYNSATGASLTSTNIWATSKIAINSSSPQAQLAITGFDGQSPLAITSSTGSSFLHILANGNVGIGTASPSTKLDVALSNATAKFHNGSTAGGLWTIGNGVIGLGNVAYYTTHGSQNLILATGGTRDTFTFGTARLTILSSNGNIGIGTTTPLGRLVVQGSGTSSPFTVVSSTAVGSMFTILANGNIGINSSTPIDDVAVSGSATTTFILDSTSATQGSCEMRKDSDGSGYTYITYNNGVQTISTTSCR